jgi:hypothetical protein
MIPGGVEVGTWEGGPRLQLTASADDATKAPSFEMTREWWYNFFYRHEAHRGMDCREDLFVPGWFRCTGTETLEVTLRASARFDSIDRADSRSTSIAVPAELFDPSETPAAAARSSSACVRQPPPSW